MNLLNECDGDSQSSKSSQWSDCSQEYEYIFGFGSVMNTSTHAPWIHGSNKSNDIDQNKTRASVSLVLPGTVVTLKKDFGFERLWNFRSTTGFTALGVRKAPSLDLASDINGVLFRVSKEMMPGFDRREVGYEKVRVPLQYIEFENIGSNNISSRINSSNSGDTKNDPTSSWYKHLGPNDLIWLYVPLSSFSKPADENHPLLQSYVDTVLQGCLEWGGEEMADAFIQSTGGWSIYFLNDTPSSRRPWLFRKDYTLIDRLLQKYEAITHFRDRKHPEEFSSAFHRCMKGTWSIPRRNKNFVGRESEIQDLRTRFAAQGGFAGTGGFDDSSIQHSVVKVEVAGMGGVGKTQLVTEYCYRQYPSEYGLVVWLNAENSESLLADFRQLLLDLAQEDAAEVDNLRKTDSSTPSTTEGLPISSTVNGSATEQDTDEIIREVKTRLFRSQVPWLLVFDNLEDRGLLKTFVPRGARSRGHVLVTSRLFDEIHDFSGCLQLGCFCPSESLELLQRAAGIHNIESNQNQLAAKKICFRLGHLPLALGMAAAYMLRCDVDCSEYLERYQLTENTGQSLLRHGKLQDYSLSVASSLSLSVVAIEKESKVAFDILRILCFLGPDLITKQLLRHLLRKFASMRGVGAERPFTSGIFVIMGTAAVATSLSCRALSVERRARFLNNRRAVLWASIALSSVSAILIASTWHTRGNTETAKAGTERNLSFSYSAMEYEQTDITWDILKSYSLLTVRDGKGSIHRLLSQALRASQSESEWKAHLNVCLYAMQCMWTFNAEDTTTWKESLLVLDHVKSVVQHCQACSLEYNQSLTAAKLSTEAGVFSAMSLNAFIDAQQSFELSISLLENARSARGRPVFQKARADALHELGRVFRYQGNYVESQRSLQDALRIYKKMASKDPASRHRVADTLHELGVLEVKKHNLESSAQFLEESLKLRRCIGNQELSDAKSAATLHQLAAIMVARKPPSLAEAKSLLEEALHRSSQVAQRAATLKQLARVTMRQGYIDSAESYLEQALELYKELYGENKTHINVAAVKFQQGALALQREQLEQAWIHFSECLRMRRAVYAYAKPIGHGNEKYPTHFEISCVLHELARVAFAQSRYQKAMDILKSEKVIIESLEESSDRHTERIFQARLTNLNWLCKCTKELGDDELANRFAIERSNLNSMTKSSKATEDVSKPESSLLAEVATTCRLAARKVALEKHGSNSKLEDLNIVLRILNKEIFKSTSDPIKDDVIRFRDEISKWKDQPSERRRVPLLSACDRMRDVLRACGHRITDTISSRRSVS